MKLKITSLALLLSTLITPSQSMDDIAMVLETNAGSRSLPIHGQESTSSRNQQQAFERVLFGRAFSVFEIRKSASPADQQQTFEQVFFDRASSVFKLFEQAPPRWIGEIQQRNKEEIGLDYNAPKLSEVITHLLTKKYGHNVTWTFVGEPTSSICLYDLMIGRFKKNPETGQIVESVRTDRRWWSFGQDDYYNVWVQTSNGEKIRVSLSFDYEGVIWSSTQTPPAYSLSRLANLGNRALFRLPV